MSSTTQVTAPGGDLRVISKKIDVSDFSVEAGAKATLINDSCEGEGCPVVGPAVELTTNGDVETGDLTGWTTFDNSGTFTIVMGNGGGSAINIKAQDVPAPGNPTLKQANIGIGTVTPGSQVTVTFDWKGTAANGGVFNVVLFSEVQWRWRQRYRPYSQ